MKKYRYYLFDLDRTLWDFDANAKNALFKLIGLLNLRALFGVEDKEAFFRRYETINHALWARYEKGEITKERLRSGRFLFTLQEYLQESRQAQALQWEKGELEAFSRLMAEKYLEYMAYETLLVPGCLDILKAVKDKGGSIAILSNGFKEVQYRKLRNSNILDYMDAVVISDEVGFLKPDPRIFRKALTALCGEEEYRKDPWGCRAAAIMAGDDFANDIAGAQRFGIDQFYYNPHGKPCDGSPTYTGGKLIDFMQLIN